MTTDREVLIHLALGLSGSLIGCACTAFAPNCTPLKIGGFCGVLVCLGALRWLWVQAGSRGRRSSHL